MVPNGSAAEEPRARPRRQEHEPASTEVVEVAPDVLRLQLPVWMPGLGHVNTYGLVDGRGLALVDPGLPGPQSWRALKDRLRRAGYRTRDVHTVVVTHSHPDHFGAAGRLARVAGAELVTHRAFSTWTVAGPDPARALSEEAARRAELEAAAAAQAADVPPEEIPTIGDEVTDAADDAPVDPVGPVDPVDPDHAGSPASGSEAERFATTTRPWGRPTPWGTRNPGPPRSRRAMIRALRLLFTPPEPTRRVRHGHVLRLGGREWSVLHTPGHTVDHLCLWDEDAGVLLSGDHVLPTITPHVSGVAEGVDSLRSYLATLDLVAELPGVRLGLPAHGHPYPDVPGRVAAIKEHHEERMALLGRAAASLGPATVPELSRAVFPRRHWGVMAESETFAHLEHMVRSGAAERVAHDPPRYRVA